MQRCDERCERRFRCVWLGPLFLGAGVLLIVLVTALSA
jgi:hypothetical protein